MDIISLEVYAQIIRDFRPKHFCITAGYYFNLDVYDVSGVATVDSIRRDAMHFIWQNYDFCQEYHLVRLYDSIFLDAQQNYPDYPPIPIVRTSDETSMLEKVENFKRKRPCKRRRDSQRKHFLKSLTEPEAAHFFRKFCVPSIFVYELEYSQRSFHYPIPRTIPVSYGENTMNALLISVFTMLQNQKLYTGGEGIFIFADHEQAHLIEVNLFNNFAFYFQ